MTAVQPLPSETRFVQGYEIRSADADGRYLDCVVTRYGTWEDIGPFDELMERGVFDATLSRHADDVKMCLGHDDTQPGVATPVQWFKEDDHLAATFKFGSHAEAQRAATLAEEKMFGGVSAAFLPGTRPEDNQWEMHDGRPRVRRRRARLVHVGLVTSPAVADAKILAVRSLGVPEDLILATPRLDSARETLARIQASRIPISR